MTFLAQAQIEARTSELWRHHQLQPAFDVEWLLDKIGLRLVWEDVEDEGGEPVLGQLMPHERLVILNERHLERLEAKQGRLRRYTVGHEIGHWVLHAGSAGSGALALFAGGRTWCRSRSADPLERQAEMFAAALLMPRDLLAEAQPRPPWQGWDYVYRLADRFLVNVTPMKIRLEQLGWMHLDDQEEPVCGPAPPAGQASLFSA